MSVEIVDPSAPVTISEAANQHFRERIQRADSQAIRLSVKESGCTGYMYDLALVDAPEEQDLDLPLGDGLHLYLDRQSLPVLLGTHIDYVREGLNSLLRFENPNAEDYCGCGESFNLSGQGTG